jgi:AraC family transcriptional regulator, transcriptional activator FtrA
MRSRHTVAAAVAPGNHPFELSVACEVFGLERRELGVPWYRFLVCAEGGRVDLGCFTLETRHGVDELARADTVIVPAWSPDTAPSPALAGALRAAYGRGARLVSFCSGAFALAAAGVLDGRRVTTHWMYADRLAAQYPEIHVLPDVLYVDDGQVLTSAGTSAGIDLSLHIVRQDYGAEIANAVARRMVVPPHRDGGQAQFVDRPVPETSDSDALGRTLDWIVDNLDQPLTVDQMAAHALMSSRTFMRRFRAGTGTTPLQWLSQQRIFHARRLLETTDAAVDYVAHTCGFGSAANLRVHFQRAVGTAPTSYRRAFRS